MIMEPDDAGAAAGDEKVSGESIRGLSGPGRSVRSPHL